MDTCAHYRHVSMQLLCAIDSRLLKQARTHLQAYSVVSVPEAPLPTTVTRCRALSWGRCDVEYTDGAKASPNMCSPPSWTAKV